MTSRVRMGAFVVALALVGACSSGGKDDKVTASDSNKTTTTLSLGSDETTTTGASGTTVEGATATTTKGGTTATTKASVGSPAPTAAQGEAAPVAAANGTYTYSQSGSTPDGPVPGTGTLVVSNPSYSRYYDQSKKPQTLNYVFNGNGAFITGATLSFKGVTANCTINSLPAPPWPPAPGSHSASGSCNVPFAGTLTVNATSRVTSRSGDIVNLSITVNAYNADRSIDVTLNDTEGWSISKRIPRTSHQVFSGKSPAGPISGDVTSTLQG